MMFFKHYVFGQKCVFLYAYLVILLIVLIHSTYKERNDVPRNIPRHPPTLPTYGY